MEVLAALCQRCQQLCTCIATHQFPLGFSPTQQTSVIAHVADGLAVPAAGLQRCTHSAPASSTGPQGHQNTTAGSRCAAQNYMQLWGLLPNSLERINHGCINACLCVCCLAQSLVQEPSAARVHSCARSRVVPNGWLRRHKHMRWQLLSRAPCRVIAACCLLLRTGQPHLPAAACPARQRAGGRLQLPGPGHAQHAQLQQAQPAAAAAGAGEP